MFGFLIILYVVTGGLVFGMMTIAGAMFYSGKWALPNSEQRKVQRATVRREVARLESETAEFQRERAQLDAKRDFEQLQSQSLLMDFQHKLTLKEIEGPKEAPSGEG